jgi:pseudouridine-5'-phosphate glycosidase
VIRLSSQVKEALAHAQPVVALETSVVAQGLPHPKSLEAAASCERAIRECGAVPATIGVLEGEIWIGLTEDQLRSLAEHPACAKIGSRDLAPILARRGTGGTTVSATCEVAAYAGIRVFATGGIGGVHRSTLGQWDVSQDLWAISKSPIGVVCAGAKSVLDVPKTLEALEALGVPVVGVGTSEFPSFYSRGSGLHLDHRVDDVDLAARMMQARIDQLGQGGLVFAVPLPEQDALPAAEIEAEIEAAVMLANRNAIQGKELTPFLLAEIARRTDGKSLAANLALLVNNARFAARLAAADARSRRSIRS